MFRAMRRSRQALDKTACERILAEGTHGVLALEGDDGYPYAVPLSYVYDQGKLWFHGARSGHKIDAIRRDPKASFCVVAQDDVRKEEYTTYFASVICFGRIRILEDEGEMTAAIDRLARRYYPEDTAAGRLKAIAKDWKPLCMLEMDIEHMTGKQSIELMNA